jgi:hypothetical protein
VGHVYLPPTYFGSSGRYRYGDCERTQSFVASYSYLHSTHSITNNITDRNPHTQPFTVGHTFTNKHSHPHCDGNPHPCASTSAADTAQRSLA